MKLENLIWILLRILLLYGIQRVEGSCDDPIVGIVDRESDYTNAPERRTDEEITIG